VVFNATELAFRYIIPGGRLPCWAGTMMANKLLIPVAGGLASTRRRPAPSSG
jgi:hypothetical protein